MEVINGNIVNIKEGFIIHQVNNRKVMGAGVAKAIRAKYPSHYDDYKNSFLTLGSNVISHVDFNLGVIGMVAQDGFGRDKDVVYTDYTAFNKCLKQIKSMHDMNPDIPYYMPYGIGCGLANGDWEIVEQLIETICPFVILVKYEKENIFQ